MRHLNFSVHVELISPATMRHWAFTDQNLARYVSRVLPTMGVEAASKLDGVLRLPSTRSAKPATA